MGRASVSLTSSIRYPHRMLQADSSRLRQHARLTRRDRLVLSARGSATDRSRRKTTMISFKALAAAVLLSATAATPAFAQSDRLYIKNLHDSGYNPKNDFNPNGTIRAAIQEPGAFAFYYPNLDVLNGGAPTPAARMSPDWPALKGACASAGGAAFSGVDRTRGVQRHARRRGALWGKGHLIGKGGQSFSPCDLAGPLQSPRGAMKRPPGPPGHPSS